MTRIVKRDKLLNNFHPMIVTLIGWRVCSELCKLLFLWYHHDVILWRECTGFFQPSERQKYTKQKNSTVLHDGVSLKGGGHSWNMVPDSTTLLLPRPLSQECLPYPLGLTLHTKNGALQFSEHNASRGNSGLPRQCQGLLLPGGRLKGTFLTQHLCVSPRASI